MYVQLRRCAAKVTSRIRKLQVNGTRFQSISNSCEVARSQIRFAWCHCHANSSLILKHIMMTSAEASQSRLKFTRRDYSPFWFMWCHFQKQPSDLEYWISMLRWLRTRLRHLRHDLIAQAFWREYVSNAKCYLDEWHTTFPGIRNECFVARSRRQVWEFRKPREATKICFNDGNQGTPGNWALPPSPTWKEITFKKRQSQIARSPHQRVHVFRISNFKESSFWSWNIFLHFLVFWYISILFCIYISILFCMWSLKYCINILRYVLVTG